MSMAISYSAQWQVSSAVATNGRIKPAEFYGAVRYCSRQLPFIRSYFYDQQDDVNNFTTDYPTLCYQGFPQLFHFNERRVC
jgi:hypothetical protein